MIRTHALGPHLSALAATLLLACGPPQKPVEAPPVTKTPAPVAKPTKPELPAIPTKVAVARVDPMDGNSPGARSPLLDQMVSENKRWMARLNTKQPAPAFYLSYQIHDLRRIVLEAEGGAITTDQDERDRFLDVDVLVGTTKVDNRRAISNDNFGLNQPLRREGRIPYGADALAVKSHLWLETDRRYREAAGQLRYVLQDKTVTKSRDSSPDFVHEKAEVYVQPVAKLSFDKKSWVTRLRRCSKKALKGKATRGTCRVQLERRTVYFVNSEGTQLQLSWTTARVMVSVGVKADDGMPLSRLEQAFAPSAEKLPSDPQIDKMIDVATSDLNALHAAPVVDPFVGPTILEGRAAGVFFHEVFGHRIEGHRQKGLVSGQTFSSKVGERIMPTWMTVYDDPTLSRLNGRYLNGFYRFDDEGVRAQRANLIDKGVLRGFDLGRNPIKGFPNSNGHGRKAPGYFTVSRQGNLVVEASHSVENSKLFQMLLAEIKKQKRPFGMIFTDISGGFTNTSRFAPQAFKVNPVMAYRVYPDGRKELVRGVDIVGTPLTALGSIQAAGRTVETFNGMCGAESGWVPVSATAPSLLLKSLEIERGFKPQDRPPLLPSPSVQRTLGGSR